MEEDARKTFGSICGHCGKPVQDGKDICPECAASAGQPDQEAIGTAQPGPREQIILEAAAGRPLRPLLGLLLGIAGGALGMGAWALLIRLTGYEIGYAAWGVGVITGLATAYGAGRGSPFMGIASGAIAAAAVVGGQLLAVLMVVDAECCKVAEEAYTKNFAFAKKAASAKNPDALRFIVAEWRTEEGKTPDPDAVSDADIQQFSEEDLPDLVMFASGDPSKDQYVDRVSVLVKSQISYVDMLKGSLSLFTGLWLLLGIGSAYRIAAGGTVIGGGREPARPRRVRAASRHTRDSTEPDSREDAGKGTGI